MLIAALTISDRCSRGQQEDTAGPAVVALVSAQWPAAEVRTTVLPDEEEQIAAALIELAQAGAALILTVGGTGLGPRDRTPEATRRIIDREAPGLAEAMRSIGAQTTPFAWLSRGVAGMRNETLILNLPGSLRGATGSLAPVLLLLGHALEVMAGGRSHPV